MLIDSHSSGDRIVKRMVLGVQLSSGQSEIKQSQGGGNDFLHMENTAHLTGYQFRFNRDMQIMKMHVIHGVTCMDGAQVSLHLCSMKMTPFGGEGQMSHA